MRRPLEDIRIVAVEQYGAGPWATLMLADLGADVIKIEDPAQRGDVGRYVPPFSEGEDSLFFESLNRNKRSIGLDLTTDAGRQVLERLVAQSDALFANVRGDVPERLGLRYEDLCHVNERLVCCLLSAFGLTGEKRNDAGYDYVMQAMAGWMSVTGEPDGAPQRAGLSLVDFSAGFAAALSLLAAVNGARRDGVGGDCDVSLFDTAIGLLNYPAAWSLNAQHHISRRPSSAHPSLVPFQSFDTADSPVVVACAKEKFWERFVEAIERRDLLDDDRFARFADRDRHRDVLLPVLAHEMAGRTAADWLERFSRHGVPAGRVNTIDEALTQPLVAERNLIVETDHPRFGAVRTVASPVSAPRQPVEHRRAPQRGEHEAELLRELFGDDDETVRSLRRGGAFGPAG